MSLSNELGAILADAERSLSPPTFDLTLAWRYAIWKALGPRDLQPGVIGEGHTSRMARDPRRQAGPADLGTSLPR